LELFTDFEWRVLRHDRFTNGEQEGALEEIDVLLASGLYEKSSGTPVGARHYRRSLTDGSCLHLVIGEGTGRLHHDTFDPHAGPFSLGMHLTHEARSEAATGLALALTLLRLLSR